MYIILLLVSSAGQLKQNGILCQSLNNFIVSNKFEVMLLGIIFDHSLFISTFCCQEIICMQLIINNHVKY